jgi:FG-GAP repeat
VPDQFWYQDTTDVNGVAQNYDEFGSALAAGDANGDGRDDLAIGVPKENQAAGIDSGGVNLIYGSASGLSATSVPDQYWSQDSGGVEDVCETNDHFGSALAFGTFTPDAWAYLAVGVPGEALPFTVGAGAINVLFGSSSGLSASGDQFWNQDRPNVDGDVDEDDSFGAALSSGDFNQDGRVDLAIGVPFENVRDQGLDQPDEGGLNVLHGSPSGLTAIGPPQDQFWTQDSPNVDGMSEPIDWFGSAAAAAG